MAAITRDTVTEKVVNRIASVILVKPEEIDVSDEIDNISPDSLDHVEVMLGLEEDFNIEIDDEKARACKTVDDLIALILDAA